ncbi:MAG: hypothetical protein JXA21_06510 [Anaerolineae bacterium]|nr:hypothetical protein [Anaerolineae bacterium]
MSDVTKPQYTVFGIRHHGPGCARSLLSALTAMQPDLLLIEGPPEGDALLPLAASPEMKPPVALLVYSVDEPGHTAVFPFAEYSPEWQAIQYALRCSIPVRFMDLPQKHWMALAKAAEKTQEAGAQEAEGKAEEAGIAAQEASSETPDVGNEAPGAPVEAPAVITLPSDPLDLLAHAAGFADGEHWWERVVEERGGDADVFPAILEAMGTVRAVIRQIDPSPRDLLEPAREATMRQNIRRAQKDGFQRIAVICGAWHAPVLETMPPVADDRVVLKGLPRLKVAATWVPWSYAHLAFESGYGAGVVSPGWYEHLWAAPEQTAANWLARVAGLLRDEDLDASSAQVIDAVRLADTLAALRGRARPGLEELNEAAQTVLCFGDPLPLKLVRQRLIVAERLGSVPPETPIVPLQADVEATQRRLHLKPEMEAKSYDFDLRQARDLERSALLHRLDLLEIHWGKEKHAARARGTFHELWDLKWDPAFSVALVAAARWGNTLVEATTAFAAHLAAESKALGQLTDLLDRVLLADLPQAVTALTTQLQAQTALSGDVEALMEAVPPLARALRYGTVRQTSGAAAFDTAAFEAILGGMITRICIGLPLACASLDDDAAQDMLKHIEGLQESLGILQNAEWDALWQDTLRKLANQGGLHGLIAGRVCRLLLDMGALDHEDVTRRLRLALSPGTPPIQAAHWLEGFLRGSGLLLLHDDALWKTLDDWLASLSHDDFVAALPLLRRTFSAFPAAERRQMGERAVGGRRRLADDGDLPVDETRADTVLPLVRQILGLENLPK